MRKVAVDQENGQHLLAYQAGQVAQMPEEKRSHFLYVLDQLLACYTTEENRALLLTTVGAGEKDQIRLMAINADEQETSELIDTLCVFRKLDERGDGLALN